MTSARMSEQTELEELIRSLEERRIDAMRRKDIDALAPLLADDLSYVHSGGRTDDKSAFLELIARPNVNYLDVTYTQWDFVPCGQDAAIVRGVVRLTLRREAPEHIIYSVVVTVVYRRRDETWQLVVWHATRAQE